MHNHPHVNVVSAESLNWPTNENTTIERFPPHTNPITIGKAQWY